MRKAVTQTTADLEINETDFSERKHVRLYNFYFSLITYKYNNIVCYITNKKIISIVYHVRYVWTKHSLSKQSEAHTLFNRVNILYTLMCIPKLITSAKRSDYPTELLPESQTTDCVYFLTKTCTSPNLNRNFIYKSLFLSFLSLAVKLMPTLSYSWNEFNTYHVSSFHKKEINVHCV